ncbi:POK25 protein, partial [Phainopepla nitens]|nr:POK25 protein [Phainopepla nitens]
TDHKTGIAHSSTGQAVVERANPTLKEYLAKQKQEGNNDVSSRPNKVLFTLNDLSLTEGRQELAIVIHHAAMKERQPKAIPGLYVYHKNMQTGVWEGP